MDWFRSCYFVAQSYSGKVTKAHLITPSGYTICIENIGLAVNYRARAFFNVQWYTKCAVINRKCALLKWQCAVMKGVVKFSNFGILCIIVIIIVYLNKLIGSHSDNWLISCRQWLPHAHEHWPAINVSVRYLFTSLRVCVNVSTSWRDCRDVIYVECWHYIRHFVII